MTRAAAILGATALTLILGAPARAGASGSPGAAAKTAKAREARKARKVRKARKARKARKRRVTRYDKARKARKRVKRYDFTGDELTVELQGPGGEQVRARNPARHGNLIRVRRDFLRQITASAEDL